MVLARGSWCEHLKGAHTHTCEFAQHGFIYWTIYDTVCCILVNICKTVLRVSTRKGTDICEFAQHGFIYKTICDMIYVYLWACVCMQRGSKCEHSQWQQHMWIRTTRFHIQNYSWYNICILILVNICIQRCPKCEHSQWHVQVWDCTARVDIQTYLSWNISILVTYVCMQRGSKCEHAQGHKHMWVGTTWAHIQMNLWCDLCSLVSTYTKRF